LIQTFRTEIKKSKTYSG